MTDESCCGRCRELLADRNELVEGQAFLLAERERMIAELDRLPAELTAKG